MACTTSAGRVEPSMGRNSARSSRLSALRSTPFTHRVGLYRTSPNAALRRDFGLHTLTAISPMFQALPTTADPCRMREDGRATSRVVVPHGPHTKHCSHRHRQREVLEIWDPVARTASRHPTRERRVSPKTLAAYEPPRWWCTSLREGEQTSQSWWGYRKYGNIP